MRRFPHAMPRAFATAALLSVLSIAPGPVALHAAHPSAAPARRHMRLLRSTPGADTTVAASPDAIRLWFSEAVDARGSSVTLTAAGSGAVALAPLTREPAKDAPLVARLVKPVGAGAYTVTWKGMSRDGHVVSGTFAFRVRGTP